MDFNTYLATVREAHATYPNWRAGQAYFNVLETVRPELAEEVRGNAALDPFYNSEAIPRFLVYILGRW